MRAVNAVVQGLLKEADDEQVRMMEERVILVDHNDKAIGSGSKKESEFPVSPCGGRAHLRPESRMRGATL